MEDLKRRRIPAFGHWDYYDDLPITQYFDSAWQAGLIRCRFWGEEEDLFNVPAPTKPEYQHDRKLKKGAGVEGEKQQGKRQTRKHSRVSEYIRDEIPRRPTRAPKAVDEDLYVIPPEFLYQKPKRKGLLRSLVSGCLGLNCVR